MSELRLSVGDKDSPEDRRNKVVATLVVATDVDGHEVHHTKILNTIDVDAIRAEVIADFNDPDATPAETGVTKEDLQARRDKAALYKKESDNKTMRELAKKAEKEVKAKSK